MQEWESQLSQIYARTSQNITHLQGRLSGPGPGSQEDPVAWVERMHSQLNTSRQTATATARQEPMRASWDGGSRPPPASAGVHAQPMPQHSTPRPPTAPQHSPGVHNTMPPPPPAAAAAAAPMTHSGGGGVDEAGLVERLREAVMRRLENEMDERGKVAGRAAEATRSEVNAIADDVVKLHREIAGTGKAMRHHELAIEALQVSVSVSA